MATLPTDSSYLVAGKYTVEMSLITESEPVTFTNENDAFMVRYSDAGDLVWAFSTSSPYGNVGHSQFRNVHAMPYGADEILMLANIQWTVDFGGTSVVTSCELTSTSDWEPAVAVYDLDGNAGWCGRIANDWSYGYGLASAIEILDDGSFLVAGLFAGEVEFLTTEGLVTVVSVGEEDGFVARVCPLTED